MIPPTYFQVDPGRATAFEIVQSITYPVHLVGLAGLFVIMWGLFDWSWSKRRLGSLSVLGYAGIGSFLLVTLYRTSPLTLVVMTGLFTLGTTAYVLQVPRQSPSDTEPSMAAESVQEQAGSDESRSTGADREPAGFSEQPTPSQDFPDKTSTDDTQQNATTDTTGDRENNAAVSDTGRENGPPDEKAGDADETAVSTERIRRLVERLESEDASERAEAAHRLGDLGASDPAAVESAMEALRSARLDTDTEVSRAASDALNCIERNE